MHSVRKIIEIDEEKCTGCGECVIACAEGALQIVDGKAKLLSDVYCDGLGACIGPCPEGALAIVEREAEEFDEDAVEEYLAGREESENGDSEAECPEPTLACGCPGSMTRTLEPLAGKGGEEAGEIGSELRHWPVKLQLLGPQAPFLKGADLLLMADCAAVAFPDLHRKIIKGNAVAIGCPKLDNLDAHIERLAEILKGASPRSLTVVHMEVPCCRGFVYAAEQAIKRAGVDVAFSRIQIGVNGEIQEREDYGSSKAAAG
jgi:Pyruvate/2-oxoacid:ferredoxin oxidoreductase delta subunit